ncbi:MAG TPA: ABC transporter ATP-binding protein [Thermoanaerobaculia bacterium]|nr:ABC transporter ATP-binding protein [Thermoanaerobaculia bacterium]
MRGLSKHFPVHHGLLRRARGTVRAVDGVDLDVDRGECVALVGESGSGKTTFARCAMRLVEPTAGSVRLGGVDLLALGAAALRRRRRDFQMVFQDPFGSLNPRMRVGRALAEPLAVHGIVPRAQRRRRVAELLDMVGLPPAAAERFPHEFSGGQRQRIGIARALATGPALLVADEPVSALDVSVRAQVVNLLADLQRRLDLALLFIAHDLALVEHVADRVAVLYLGRVVEEAPRDALFARPQHPYTVGLLASVPVPEPSAGRRTRRAPLGDPPSPLAPPPGCPFHPRCPIARERCAAEAPPLAEVAPGHRVACWFPGEAAAEGGTFTGEARKL